MEALYKSGLARYLDQYPKYRKVLLWFIAILSSALFLMMIFPAVVMDEERNEEGTPKSVYQTFGRMNWGEYSTKIALSGADVDINFRLAIVGFAMYTQIRSIFFSVEEYQYAMWSDCNSANHTTTITHGDSGPYLSDDTASGNSTNTDDTISGNSTSNYAAMSWHRHLAQKDSADLTCESAASDCMKAFTSSEGLTGVILFFGAVGMGLAAYRLYVPTSRVAHAGNTVAWLLVMIITSSIVGTFEGSCVGSIEKFFKDREKELPSDATIITTVKPGNTYNIYIAIAVLSAVVFVVNTLVFPAKDSKPLEESGKTNTSLAKDEPKPHVPAPTAVVKNPIAEPHSQL